MIATIAILSPFIITILWAVILLFSKNKGRAETTFMWFLLILAAYFFCESHFILPQTRYDRLVYCDIAVTFLALMVPPAIWMYLRAVEGKPDTWRMLFYFIPAVVLGTMSATIYSLIGIEEAAVFQAARFATGDNPIGFNSPLYQMYREWPSKTFMLVFMIMFFITIGAIVIKAIRHKFSIRKVFGFFFHGGVCSPLDLIYFSLLLAMIVSAVRLAFGHFWLLDHKTFSAALSLLTALLIYVMASLATVPFKSDISLSAVLNPEIWREIKAQTPGRFEEDEDGEMAADEKLQAPVVQGAAAEWKDLSADLQKSVEEQQEDPDASKESLLEMFNKCMDEEKPYLDPNLTIENLAAHLNTNKTYISILVNQNFRMTFRNYINIKRIEHAKSLILASPDELLDFIATDSGFLSSSQLNKKFKEIEGISPRQWQIAQYQANAKQ